jgi:hypothetical protein
VIMDIQSVGSWVGELQAIHAEGFKEGDGSSVGAFRYQEPSLQRHQFLPVFIYKDDADFRLFASLKGVKFKLHGDEEGGVSEGEAHAPDGVKHSDKATFPTIHPTGIIAELAKGDAHSLLMLSQTGKGILFSGGDELFSVVPRSTPKKGALTP